MMTKYGERSTPSQSEIRQASAAHLQARALFALRLNLKALTVTLSYDEVIAHPSGFPINASGFHADALSRVRELGISLTRACFSQMIECLRVSHEGGNLAIVTVLRAIRIYLERVAEQLWPQHLTNDRRVIASEQSVAARDLCTLALENFAINNMRENGA